MAQHANRRPCIIGITGGIGSGKSTVAAMLGELGAEVLNADALAHQALRRDDVRSSIRRQWGGAVFGPDGHIDRQAMARVAFSDEENVRQLERIVHPHVLEAIRTRIGRSGAPAVAIDAPLLTEANLHDLCDVVLFVEAPEAQRLSRVEARGWSAQELRRREARQHSLLEKRKCSRIVIENGQSLSATRKQVVDFWHEHATRHCYAAEEHQEGLEGPV